MADSAVWGWPSGTVERHVQPAAETGEHTLDHHVIAVHLGRPINVVNYASGRPRRLRPTPGDMSVVPAGVLAREHWDGVAEYLVVRLAPNVLADAAGVEQDAEIVPALGVRDPVAQQVCLALLAQLEAAAPIPRLYAEAAATFLGAHLLARYSTLPHGSAADLEAEPSGAAVLPPAALRRVTDYVEAHLADDLAVSDLARVAGLSPYHFTRLFKRATGLSPYQFVLRHRAERARLLLLAGGVSSSAVADAVGFCDQTHLARHLRRAFGVTPKDLTPSRPTRTR